MGSPANDSDQVTHMNKLETCENIAHPKRVIPEEKVARLKQGDPAVLITDEKGTRPSPKVLAIHPEKCNGCRLCEAACTLVKTGDVDPGGSRIRVME